ncbi:pyridoxamine 5'-phosphate oxidase family protein [Actinomadura graeca]|uniref:Pyridoxamine 5'-phosphate oxidase family protein n=1 Tax=Actinomadura graeca TaxID=2750812 RepID=A0ABX8QY66_9ACTN|nr:pyridoxamine 5'-phosphate oxidase family protein [Actinomadura graeca]QXJ22642.1 pyridoxamine 5'-phosphate oxidase family protein [Actinomadura graeca]
MHLDRSGLEILDVRECRALLARAVVGRVVFTEHALPAVQPVNFIVHADDVVIRTARASRLATAARQTVVAFEIDEFDATARTGWSVVIIGHARLVTASEEIAALEDLPLRSWMPGHRDQYIRIRPELVSGRRIPVDA